MEVNETKYSTSISDLQISNEKMVTNIKHLASWVKGQYSLITTIFRGSELPEFMARIMDPNVR